MSGLSPSCLSGQQARSSKLLQGFPNYIYLCAAGSDCIKAAVSALLETVGVCKPQESTASKEIGLQLASEAIDVDTVALTECRLVAIARDCS